MKVLTSSLFRLLMLTVLALCFCFPAHGNPPAAIDSAPEFLSISGQSALSIPFEISGKGHIFLRVSINRSEPLWFGLDSGTEQTLISQQQAKAQNLKLQGGMQAAGSGEDTVDFALARNVSFSLSGVNLTLAEVGVLPLEFASPVPGQAIGGLLGYDFIRRFVLEIDYAARVIKLYRPRGYRYRGRGEIIPISMLDNNPYIPVKVALPGLKPIRGMFMIDSGADTDIEFYSPFVKRYKLLNSTQETIEASALGIGGTSKIRIGYATNVQIGRALIANPVVQFSQATRGDDTNAIGAGIIGGKLLRQFKTVIFDPSRRRIILEPAV
ncbi:MAG TPA: aspartyl protease family protein [Pyrinomonadaceae bacterium]|nr:aspartyl protease family protein [Pyrinomonadaceae bacterium]